MAQKMSKLEAPVRPQKNGQNCKIKVDKQYTFIKLNSCLYGTLSLT